MIKTVVILGPTASGKTALSVELAKRFGFEIVCADSMQIYSELSISTARPTIDEMCGIPHHLFGTVSVKREYSVADYCYEAGNMIKNLHQKGIKPLLCGGTGLYIDSLLKGTDFTQSSADKAVMDTLLAEYEKFGADHMHNELKKVDSISAENIHPNNVKRVLRALEIYRVCGQPKSVLDKKAREHNSIYTPLYIGVNFKDRQKLYERVEARVDKMIECGLVSEVQEFYSCNPCKTALGAIGCKELKPYLDGEKSLDECISDLKTATRRYAKRQLTWFNRNKDINWVYPDEQGFDGCINNAQNLVKEFLGGDV